MKSPALPGAALALLCLPATAGALDFEPAMKADIAVSTSDAGLKLAATSDGG